LPAGNLEHVEEASLLKERRALAALKELAEPGGVP